VRHQLERGARRAHPRHPAHAGPLSPVLPPAHPRDHRRSRQMTDAPLRVFVVGLGQMGRSHALAYHADPGFEIIGLHNRSPVELPPELGRYAMLESFEAGLALRPDVVSINTYTDSHAAL